MKYYLISVKREEAKLIYPETGHTDYWNIGYNLDLTQCIWEADNNIKIPVGENCTEISEDEMNELVEKWGAEITAEREKQKEKQEE